MKTLEQTVQDTTTGVTNTIKRSIYDVVAAVIVVAIVVTTLGIFGFTPWSSIWDLLVEFGTFFFASLVLAFNRYEKGNYVGKSTVKFNNAIKAYSDEVDHITGGELPAMYEFCDEFNEQALKDCQTRLLKKQGLQQEYLYANFTYNGKQYAPLCSMTKKEIRNNFNKNQAKAIFAALSATVKGISPETLMTELEVNDRTDTGATENKLKEHNAVKTTFVYVLAAIVFSLIGLNDITKWNWAGLLIVIFKTCYAFAKSYTSYFRGYDDITIRLLNHVLRKTDILKQYKAWYSTHSIETTNCNTNNNQ